MPSDMLFLHRGPLSQTEELGPSVIILRPFNICEVNCDTSIGKD
jgi:hypothetical protein